MSVDIHVSRGEVPPREFSGDVGDDSCSEEICPMVRWVLRGFRSPEAEKEEVKPPLWAGEGEV